MDHFNYKNGELYAENIAIKDIAAKVGTPFYCYSKATLLRHYNVFTEGFKGVKNEITVCYSVKSNSNLAVIKTLADAGSGGDCVSEGEIRRCLAAGIPAKKIIFAGVGKTRAEMRYALEQGILQFNVESEPELEILNEVALSLGTTAPIAFRVNPEVDAMTHDKISTGRKEDKFGVEWGHALTLYKRASDLEGIKIQGVAVHIGSQLSSLEPFRKAFEKVTWLVEELWKNGHDITLINLGGGLGIPYSNQTLPSPDAYAKMVMETVGKLGCHLAFEPGRVICGNAGILVASVIYLKHSSHKKFLIIDAAMNDLIRPALYDAHHEIVPVIKESDYENFEMDVVGPVCESSDVFAKGRLLPALAPDDLVAIRSAGAYGAVMASTYNSRPLVPEVLVSGSKFKVIRKRQTYEELLGLDKMS